MRPTVLGFVHVQGPIVVELYDVHAPLACQNFVGLAQRGYYDGTIFHRIIRVCARKCVPACALFVAEILRQLFLLPRARLEPAPSTFTSSFHCA